MDTSKILENILLTIRCFINRYQCDDNFLFLSESDIQCSLYSDLMKTVNYRLTLPITENLGIDRVPPAINIIQTEYASGIDIACIDPGESSKIIDEKLNDRVPINMFLWRLPLLAGIEIKYIQQYNYKEKFDSFLRDIDKLKGIKEDRSQQSWHKNMDCIALAFLQNDSLWSKKIESYFKLTKYKDEYECEYIREIKDSDLLEFDGFIISPKQIFRIKKIEK